MNSKLSCLNLLFCINIPSEYQLFQNYPNPFNPSTTIEYEIKSESFVSLKIYDSGGRQISQLVNSKHKPGAYTVNFEAGGLPSGIYFYELSSDGFAESKKMVLVK